MKNRVCYLGDGSLSTAGAYLAGAMGYAGLPYDYVASNEKVPSDVLAEPYALYVLSDYPSGGFTIPQLEQLAQHINAGAGLLMIGGWESFFGRVGEYWRRPIEHVLPVYLLQSDDRVNCPQGCVLRQVKPHPITDYIPWDRPPVVAGFNRVFPRPGSLTLLEGDRLQITDSGGELEFAVVERVPFLVVGRFGGGRTAALACDVAPHWSGGAVDWGTRRIVWQIPAGGFVEIGDAYAQFLKQLLLWTGRFAELPDEYPEPPQADLVPPGKTPTQSRGETSLV